MGGDRDKASSDARGKGAESRKERLAAALRANLKRRKRAGTGRAKSRKDEKAGG